MLSPNRVITIMATVRSPSAERPVVFTIADRASVKKVKLKINPVIIPSGRFLPPVNDPERTIGRMGRIQGERMVTIPAKKAKIIRSIIIVLLCIGYQFF
jgi:hypothetical protein